MTFKDVKKYGFRLALYLPQVQAHIKREGSDTVTKVVEKFSKLRKGKTLLALPQKGEEESKILEKVSLMTNEWAKLYTTGAGMSGGIYTADMAHWAFIAKVMGQTIISNPLHIDEFIDVTRCEAEIIRWTLNLFNGDKEACGVITSGGTESIMLCILAYREQAKFQRGVSKPNIVGSELIHPAFLKACFYFGIEVRLARIKDDFTLDLKHYSSLIDSNTICLVSNSPDFPYGNYDNTPKIAKLAQSWGIGCHSDCCLGSFVNVCAVKLGYNVPFEYDFKVPGVTSISCDPHKYAYGPKGCSVAMFRSKELREFQLFVGTKWQGGIYATTCVAGSRPGNIVIGTWASMLK